MNYECFKASWHLFSKSICKSIHIFFSCLLILFNANEQVKKNVIDMVESHSAFAAPGYDIEP